MGLPRGRGGCLDIMESCTYSVSYQDSAFPDRDCSTLILGFLAFHKNHTFLLCLGPLRLIHNEQTVLASALARKANERPLSIGIILHLIDCSHQQRARKEKRSVMSGEGNEPVHPPGGVDPLHHATSPPQSEPIYVTNLTPNDILLGRGAPIINYEGNVRFRDLVRTRKKEYVGTGRHQIKDDIARQIIEEIIRRKGRFLRKVNPHQEDVSRLHLNGKEKVWRVAEEDVAIEKVKQALRDKEPVKPSQSPPLADAGLIAGVNNSNNMNNATAAMLWGDMAAAQGFGAGGGLPNTGALANAPTSMWNPSNAAATAAALNITNNGGLNDVAAAAAAMGMMQPSDQLALMLQQRQQEFLRQQQLNMLQSQLIRNQQFGILQRQQQQNTTPQQPSSETDGSAPGRDMASVHQHQQLLQQISSSPSGPAILAALQASVGQQQQQNRQQMLQQQIQQQIQQLQLQQQQQQQQESNNVQQQNQQQNPQQQNQESAKAAVSESSDSHANNRASSSSSGTDEDEEEEDNRDQKRKAEASSSGSDKRVKSSECETDTDSQEQRT